MRITFFLTICFCSQIMRAQPIAQRLEKKFNLFEKDNQLRHAISSLYVIDAKTGAVVFERNAQVGLAPASTQKIITATTAFDLLGADFRYKTSLAYSGDILERKLYGDLYLLGSGDPTLGSQRWNSTRADQLLQDWTKAVHRVGIRSITGKVTTNTSRFAFQAIPDGWIWQDIGNYYGAGSYALNWKENQFDLQLRSGSKPGEDVELRQPNAANLINGLKAAPAGTGDNAYMYYDGSLSGTIPVNEKSFSISVSDKDPVKTVLQDLAQALKNDSVGLAMDKGATVRENYPGDTSSWKKLHAFYTSYSPTLDSMVYWFLRKSINLYGEALIKTLALAKQGYARTDSGVAIIQQFWKERGVDAEELNISDGSGLSPQNRVTTHAQVEVLKYARSRNWFPAFYEALPVYNGMKMKSGTIRDVKAFCGYQASKDGHLYIFSFIVNNFSGPTSSVVTKMYAVLDELK